VENLTNEGIWFWRILIMVSLWLLSGLVVSAILPEGLTIKLAKVAGKIILIILGAAVTLASGAGLYYVLLKLDITLTSIPR